MTDNEIIVYLMENIPTIGSFINVVTGAILTAIFLRRNTKKQEFEKIKAAKFGEVVDDLLNSGQMTHTEYYKAKNFLKVAEKADAYYKGKKNSVQPESLDFDWIIRFYEAASNVSDEEIQDLWGKLLSGEINKPGSYSLRTIDVLKNFGKKEAQFFDRICYHSLEFEGNRFLPRYKEYLDATNISYNDILILIELGLVHSSSNIYNVFHMCEREGILVFNNSFGLSYSISEKKDHLEFSINQHPFTNVGNEIASLKEYTVSNEEFHLFVDCLNEHVDGTAFTLPENEVWEA